MLDSMIYIKFATDYEEMGISKRYELVFLLSSTYQENATYT